MTDVKQTGRFSRKELLDATENEFYGADVIQVVENAYTDPATLNVLNELMNAKYTDEDGRFHYLFETALDVVDFLYDCTDNGLLAEGTITKINNMLSFEGWRKLIARLGIARFETMIGRPGILNSDEVQQVNYINHNIW